MNKKRDLPIVGLVIVLVLATLVLILILAFKPVEGEEEVYWELYSKDWRTYMTEEEFSQYFRVTAEEAAAIEAKILTAGARQYAPPIKNLTLSSARFTSQEQAINTLVYEIAQEVCISNLVKGLPKELMDPLIILAQANAENGGVRGSDFKILSPAIPAAYIQPNAITPELVKGFNIREAIKLDMDLAFNWKNSTYIGPLQEHSGYGSGPTSNEFKSLLMYPEGEAEIIGADEAIYSGVVSAGKNLKVSIYPGDRWNWNDACVRAVASWDYSFKAMKSDKEGLISDKYKLAAILALNHNVGCSVLQSAMTVQSGGFVKEASGDGATIQDIWNFADWLSSPLVVAQITKIAEEDIASNNITRRPRADRDMTKLISLFGDSMEKGTFDKLNKVYSLKGIGVKNGWYSEPPMHALTLVYNYIMLEKLYSGR